jgi:hypothetical protein
LNIALAAGIKAAASPAACPPCLDPQGDAKRFTGPLSEAVGFLGRQPASEHLEGLGILALPLRLHIKVKMSRQAQRSIDNWRSARTTRYVAGLRMAGMPER